MDQLDNLPDGVAARIRQIQDEEDDEVNYNIPSTWGANHAADVFRSEFTSSRSASSTSNVFDTSNTSRGFAPALASFKKRRDPYESRHLSGFSFSSVTPATLDSSTWDTYDPKDPDQSETSLMPHVQNGQESASTGERGDVNDPRNKALEGTFGSTSVRRVTEEGSEWRDLSLPDLDPRLADPNLDIDANVRANFIPINQLYRAKAQPSASALRNPNLIASNTGGSISTVIAGETITYRPQSGDTRLGMLDRHGNYLGKYKGEIKKSRIRQYREDVRERDTQMQQATAEYRELAAMSAEDRADLLERLRKPYEWQGAFIEDQHDEPRIPDIYTRKIPTDRFLNWMADEFSQISIQSIGGYTTSASGSTSARPTSSINSDTPDGDLGGFDDFGADSMFISPESPRPRSRQYLRDLLNYGKSRRPRNSVSQRSTSSARTQITTRFDQASFSGAVVGRSSNASMPSRGLDDAFSFDDSPEFQFPDDYPIESEVRMSQEQARTYKSAIDFSERYGRVVLVHLHQLVKFTPGAIASHVHGGIIQEIQLFPVQRVAIVIFLHPCEAQAFVRHVKNVRESGREEEIRALQIEVGWNKGIENPHSILPAQPQILTHHVTSDATRCLRLHHLPVTKTREEVSFELGRRLSMPLLTVILCPPKPDYLRPGRAAQMFRDARFDDDAPMGAEARLGRQAIVEFVSINDAIHARKLMIDGIVDEYEGCEPVFASDPSARLWTERSYCTCAGCKEIRKAKSFG